MPIEPSGNMGIAAYLLRHIHPRLPCYSLFYPTNYVSSRPMKFYLYILLLLCLIGMATSAQAQRHGGNRGGFSLANLSSSNKEIPDSLLLADSTALKEKRVVGYWLTPTLGERYIAPMDTDRLNTATSQLVEYNALAVGYLANVGSPAQSKIFRDRKEERDFIFADAYDYYITTPTNAYFYDTKIPYTHATYTTGGASQSKMDRLKGVLTLNFGKKINVGAEMDYIYSRGYYDSNGNKLLSYRLFGSYISDRYELNAYLSNFNFINYENGGLTNDQYITNPDELAENQRGTESKSFPVRFSDTWNRVRGKQYFLTHRYNLGFTRELEETDEEGNPKEVFVPVSSIIHTIHYEDNRRRFISNSNGIDTCYTNIYGIDASLNDQTSAWNLRNTFALSLREGFQDWVKFGLTAYVAFEKRRFRLATQVPGLDYSGNGTGQSVPSTLNFPASQVYDEFTTYIGGELAKRQGSLLTYNVRAELGLAGSDAGELRVSGDLQTKFSLFQKDATIRAEGYIKNLTPAFYQRHFHGRYFWWDRELSNVQRMYAGATIDLASTRTRLSGGVESIQNYVYFGSDGQPRQHSGNLQVISLRAKQDIKYRAFGWENEVAYQLSSDKSTLPLPDFSAYSNIYLHFRLAKVLTVQLGANVYYHTAYYAPYYEPATQQFQLQDESNRVKVGNYPLINAYANFHLKQARFFVMAYNLGSKFVDPNYFSLPHYPLDPMVLKMGVSVVFNN